MIDILLLCIILYLFTQQTTLISENSYLIKRNSDLTSRICDIEIELSQLRKNLRAEKRETSKK